MLPLDLEELIAETAERSAARLHARGMQLTVRVEEAAPVIGAPALIGLVLSNLLDNALRHTPPGGQIVLSLQAASDGVTIAVSDTGAGIPEEHLTRIFERFYRPDRSRTREAGGSGLGLAICAWVAQVHNGRLTVASQLGRGTTFTLCLPAAPPSMTGTSRHQSRLPQPLASAGARRR
jgi:signal transduction histidine kinase